MTSKEVVKEIYEYLEALERGVAPEMDTKKIHDWLNNLIDQFLNSQQDAIVQNVLDKYSGRSQAGIKKYGTTLEENQSVDLDYWLTHLQEELMDATLYIEKLKTLKNS